MFLPIDIQMQIFVNIWDFFLRLLPVLRYTFYTHFLSSKPNINFMLELLYRQQTRTTNQFQGVFVNKKKTKPKGMQQQIEETHASFDLRSHPQSKTIPEVYKAYRADISIQRPIYACTICQLYWCVCVCECFMLLSMTSFVFSRRVRVDKLQQKRTYLQS